MVWWSCVYIPKKPNGNGSKLKITDVVFPLEFHDRIFGKFAQATDSSTRQKEGAGLGLHISKSLIEKMQGQIGFESIEK